MADKETKEQEGQAAATEVNTTTVQAQARNTTQKPKAEENPFPHKRHYEDGYIFNLALSHYENHTEHEIRQALVDAGTEPEHVEPHMNLIKEGMAFHKTSIGAAVKKSA